MKLFKFAMMGICVLAISSCTKKEPTPTPVDANTNNSNNNNNNNTSAHNQSMCEGTTDSICTFPFYIMPYFVPSGYYQYSEPTVAFALDAAETPEYENQNIRITYPWKPDTYWGASFLNNNNWSNTACKIKPGAKKLSLYARINYSANVTFLAFGNSSVGKLELYKKANPVTPAWELVEISLTNPPASFNTPLGIVIDGYSGTSGDVITVDIKDIKIE